MPILIPADDPSFSLFPETSSSSHEPPSSKAGEGCAGAEDPPIGDQAADNPQAGSTKHGSGKSAEAVEALEAARAQRDTGRGPGRRRGYRRGCRRAPTDIHHNSSHSRFVAADVMYHVVFKTLQSRFLIRPDADGQLRDLITGVIARARRNWPKVELFAATFLSTHAHMMIRAPARSATAFIGFIKREISRRWGPKVNWWGAMWVRYKATAVITEAAQERCLKYVLAQSVKEFLVATPEEWPGFHCAVPLMTGEDMHGHWLNATKYSRARYRALRRREPMPDRALFLEPESLSFDAIPAWADRAPEEYAAQVRRLVMAIISDAEQARKTRRLPEPNVQRVLDINPLARGKRPPSGSEVEPARRRRRLIVWDDLRVPEVRNYLRRYHRFQRRFRSAALRLLRGELDVDFPAAAFRPGFAQERCLSRQQLAQGTAAA